MFLQVIPPHLIYDILWYLNPSHSIMLGYKVHMDGQHNILAPSFLDSSILVIFSLLYFSYQFPLSYLVIILKYSSSKMICLCTLYDITYHSVSIRPVFPFIWPFEHPYSYFLLDHQLFLFFCLFPYIV